MVVDLELEQNFVNITEIIKAKSERLIGELRMVEINVKNFNDTKDMIYH